jgi:GNAT superfamily N-acetyltransferase
VFGVDRQLILDQSYYVIEAADGLAACGGWSRRRTLFGADGADDRDDQELTPGSEPAKIRAFFVDPRYARRGLASRLLQVCEAAAQAFGFTEAELGATLTGEPLYARHGYAPLERYAAPLRNGLVLPLVRMARPLGPAALP